MQQDKLVTFRAFTDWFRDVYPDRFREEELQRPDDVDPNRKVGLKARYEEYKIAFNAKQVRASVLPISVLSHTYLFYSAGSHPVRKTPENGLVFGEIRPA